MLDPVQAVTWVWVHTMLQGGVFTNEVEGLLAAAAPFGITRANIQEFLASDAWCFPGSTRQKQSQLYRIFDARRVSQDAPGKLKCTCAELLGLYGMLRFFFESRAAVLEELVGHLASFRAACLVLDINHSSTSNASLHLAVYRLFV